MVGIQAISSAAFGFSQPFMPLFIAQLGVHPIATVSLWSGVIGSINFFAAAFFAPVWGGLADRVGRKPMVVRSSIFGCITSALMGLSQNVWELAGARGLMGMFSGFASAATALVGSQVPQESLGFAMGWMSTAQMIGTLVGPLIGGLIADRLGDYRSVFFWTAAGTLVAAAGCAAYVREDVKPEPRAERARTPLWRQYREILVHPEVVPIFFILILAQVTTLSVSPILPLFVRSIAGDSPWLATFAGAAFAITGVAGLVTAPWLGKRSDEIGYRRILLVTTAGAALFTFPQAFVHDIWVFLALRFALGLFLGGILPTANAWVGRLFPPEQRGRVYGISYSATFTGMFLGPLLGGAVAAAFGFQAVFLVTGLLTVLNFLWLAFYLRPATD
jgi:DHA1 family multidrug resistance protein-like MFS transporter